MAIPLHVLILEDNLSDAELVLHELRRAGYDPQWQQVDDEPGFLAALEALPDLILADYRLPQFDGLRALQRVKERHLDIPFIIISGTIGEDLAVEAMRQGAVDYLLKDRLARIGQAVAQALEQKRLRAEMRQAEEALRESEQRYRTITENMSDTVWLMDLGFQTTWISPSVIRTRGYTLEELQSLPLDKQLTPESLQRVQALMVSELTPEKLADKNCEITVAGEFEFYRKDGSVFWADNVITLLRDSNGVPTGFLGVGRDITGRKQAEARLAEEQTLLQNLMDTIPDSIYFKDRSSRFIRINQAQAVRFGLNDPAQALGKTDFDFFAEEHARMAYEDEQSIIRTGLPIVNIEERETWSDRPDTWVLTTKMPLADKEGSIVGTFGVSRDVTERKQAEEALRASEERFHSLFDNSTIGLYRTTPAGAILLANPTLIHMLGFDTFDELARRDLEREGYASEYARSQFRERLEREGEVKGLEATWTRKDGSAIFVRESAKAVRGPDGKVLYYEGTVEDISERRLAEEALRIAEEKYRLIVENSVEGIFQSTPQGGLLTANPALARMFGYSSPEGLIAGASDLNRLFYVGPDRRQEFIRLLDEQEAITGFESQIYRKDGSIVWVTENARAVRDQEGKLLYYEGTVLDITERKRAELALRESEARWRVLVNTLPDFVALHDSQARFLFMNRYAAGFSQQEVLGTSAYQYLVPESRELFRQQFESCLATGETMRFEYAGLGDDGVIRWYEESLTRLMENDRPTVLALARDITERKRADAALREAEIKYRTLVEQVPAVIYIEAGDESSSSIFISPQIETMSGCSPEEWMSDQELWFKVIHPDDRAQVITENHRTNETGQPFKTEYRLLTRDGRTIWIRDEAVLLRDEAGQPLYWQGVMIDISELKQAEQQIKASLAEKEVLLKEIHHRVKNNLAIVSSLLDMQARRSQDERVRNEFKVSQQRILAMAQIHEQLYRSQNLAQIDMEDYVTALTDGLLAMDILSDVVMKVEIRDVRLDIDQAVPCGLIINELLTNALKYAFSSAEIPGAPTSQQRKKILVAMQTENKNYVLHVSDNGCGLPAGLDIQSTRTLGLKLVHRLTAQLEGDLWVDSVPGGGTTIKISFPVVGGV